MAESISIVMKMQEDISSKLKTIASTSQGCSKEFEEFQRRAAELGQRFTALNMRYKDFNDRAAEAKAGAEALKLQMSEMVKTARQSGESLNQVEFEKLQKRYQELTADARGYSEAAKDTMKDMKGIEEEVRKMEFSESDTSSGGRSSASGSGEILDLQYGMAASKMAEAIGSSIAEAADVMLTSAVGEQAGSFAGSVLSGAASGLEAGQFLLESGDLLGFEGLSGLAGLGGMVGLGAISGLISAAMQVFEDYDNSFKDYYGGLYDVAGAKTQESLSSGSGLAASRETTKLSFTTLLGGEEQSDAFLGDVLTTANTTPFLYDDLVGISKTLLSFGTAVDDIIPTLTKVGDAGAALGLSTGDIGTVSTYLGRMQSSDKASLEYLNPLNERGFSVFQWLADDLGVSINEVYDKISKSELTGTYVSDVILGQFEKLYGGMMSVQSKSTEGLDSTLQGLKENVDAAGGASYNALRNEAKEADIAAYGGALGDKLAELSAVTGRVEAYGENLKDQFQREALEAVLLGDLDKGTTVFSEEDAEKLDGLAAEFAEAEEAYKNGSMEAGQKMTDLREEAEALAQAAYESSEWYQALQEAELDEIAAIRELTAGLAANTNALNKRDELSKGVMATTYGQNKLLSFFGIGRTADDNQKSKENLESLGLYAYGLDYVPYDEFPALLHQGERVLTAAEAREMDRGVLAGAGSFAFGLSAAPYDGFPALLHQGERITPPAESRSGGDIQVTVTGNTFQVRQESDVDEIAEALAQKLQNAMLRAGG